MICAALGAVACAGLLVLWAGARGSSTYPVQSHHSDRAAREFAAPEPLVTQTSPGATRVASHPSIDETVIGDPDALAALIVALGDADANVRVDAISDLGLSSDRRAESLLAITAMQDPMPQVRVEALYALETLRGASAPDVFSHALNDLDAEVREAARAALEELKSEPPDDAD
jgi:hypothetical protein